MALEKATATVSGQTALTPTDKSDIKSTLGYEDSTELDARDTANRDRTNHTGVQAISTVSGLQTALDGKAPLSHTHDASDVISGQFSYDRLPIDPTQVDNWNTAYSWGDHASEGYLKDSSYYSVFESGGSISFGGGTISGTLTTSQKNMAFKVGQGVKIYYDANNVVNAVITAYTPATGVLSVSIEEWIGNGTYLSQNCYVSLGIDPSLNKQNALSTQTGTTITLSSELKQSIIRTTNSSTVTLTLSTAYSAYYRVGERITIIQGGTGRVQAVADTGVTIHSYEGNYTFGQHAAIELIKLDTNTWNLIGGTTL